MWYTARLDSGGVSSVCPSSVLQRDGMYENYVTAFSPAGARCNTDKTMTELRENCIWRRCSVSRTRSRLKLYELAVKCLGDVGQLKFLAFQPSLHSNIFAPRAKDGFISVVLAYSFATHLCPFICIVLSRLTLPRKRGITLASAINRDKSRVDIRGEIRNS